MKLYLLKGVIAFLFLFGMICSAYSIEYSIDTLVFNATFNHTTWFTLNGWSRVAYHDGSCIGSSPYGQAGYLADPINTLNESAFGGDITAAQYAWTYIEHSFDDTSIYNSSTGIDTIISFKAYLSNSSSGNHQIQIIIYDTSNNPVLYFSIHDAADGYSDKSLIYEGSNIPNAGNIRCQNAFSFGHGFHQYELDFKSIDNRLSVYQDDEKICDDINVFAGVPVYIHAIRLKMDCSIGIRTDKAITDIMVFTGMLSGELPASCTYPSLFCDNFNYDTSLVDTKNWIVYDYSNSIDTDFAPDVSKLSWQTSKITAVGHEIDRFPVSYAQDAIVTVTQSLEAPVFSNEFDINLTNITTGYLNFKAFDHESDLCWTARWKTNGSITFQVYNITSDDYEDVIGIDINDMNTMKFISKFTSINKTYPFNTSYSYNTLSLFLGESSLGSWPFYDDCDSIYYPTFTKENSNLNATIDNYYMYAGTDKYTDTVPYYTIELYDPPSEENFTTGNISQKDLSQVVSDFWPTMGFKSDASRVMLGVGLMFIVAILIIGAFMSAKLPVNFGVLMAVEVMFMIFLAYIKLLPTWLIVVIILLSAGGGVMFLKYHLSSGG